MTELGIYSAMWSEHYSYKNSIAVLQTLPREQEALLVGTGDENPGLVDIRDGLAVAFKIESHSNPSAVEPYQWAATGVEGIHRRSLRQHWTLEGGLHLYWFIAVSQR